MAEESVEGTTAEGVAVDVDGDGSDSVNIQRGDGTVIHIDIPD